MAKCKILYNTQGEKIGVTEMNSNNLSQTFQNILNDPHTKNFDEAISIYKNLYSEDIEFISERVADKLPLEEIKAQKILKKITTNPSFLNMLEDLKILEKVC